MRILLVKAGQRSHAIDRNVIPPLGVLSLAAWLRKCGETDVRVLDLHVDSRERYIRVLQEWSPEVVGISAVTMEAPVAHELAALAKQHARASCHVVMGGPHPTGSAAEVLEDSHVDVAVLHEGEITLGELVGPLVRGGDLAGIDGIAYRDADGGVQLTQPREYIQKLDQLPFPAWDLVDFSKYAKHHSMSVVGGRRPTAPILTSRACPYQCTYCHDVFGKQFRTRSVENVLDELQMLTDQYGIRHFEIVDDIFNMDRNRTRHILQGIIDRKLDIRLAFPNGLRGDLLNEELIDLFAKAGTEHVALAVETASKRLQKLIKKHMNLDKIQVAIRQFVERRIFTNVHYMLGFPTETVEEMRMTVDFACRQPAHSSMFFLVIPFQGTEMGEQTGPVHRDFDRYSIYRANFNLSEHIPSAMLYRTAKLAYLRFFANPARLWRLLRDHPNKRVIWSSTLALVRKIAFDNLNNPKFIDRLRQRAGFDPVH